MILRALLALLLFTTAVRAETHAVEGADFPSEGAELADDIARLRRAEDPAARAAIEREIAAFTRALETLNVLNDPNRSLEEVTSLLRQYADTAAPEDRAAVSAAIAAADKLQERLAAISRGDAAATAGAGAAGEAGKSPYSSPALGAAGSPDSLLARLGLAGVPEASRGAFLATAPGTPDAEEIGRVTRLARLLLRRLSELAQEMVARVTAVVGGSSARPPANRFRLPTKLASVLSLRDDARAQAPLTKEDEDVAFGALLVLALAGGAALPAALFLLVALLRRRREPDAEVEEKPLAA